MAPTVAIRVLRRSVFEEVGRVSLGEDGRAVVEPGSAASYLDPVVIVDLDDASRRRLTVDDGQAYIDALPKQLAGAYLRAVEVS